MFLIFIESSFLKTFSQLFFAVAQFQQHFQRIFGGIIFYNIKTKNLILSQTFLELVLLVPKPIFFKYAVHSLQLFKFLLQIIEPIFPHTVKAINTIKKYCITT